MLSGKSIVSDLLRWFGEQSEAVKLALIGLTGGVSAGFWAAIREWKKPVLNAQPAVVHTTATAPRAADDPVLLLLNEVAAMNVCLAQLLAVTVAQEPSQSARTANVIEEITALKSEIYLLRNIINQRGIGM